MTKKIQKALQVDIIKRFMSDQNFTDLYDDYCSNRHRQRRGREVTPIDRKIYKDYMGDTTVSELCEKYSKSRPSIFTAIALVAKEQ